MAWVYRNGKVVLRGGPEDIRTPVAASHLPRPMIINDVLGDVWNPATGKTYDSKSNYYRDTKAMGCEILGNDKITPKDNDHGPSDTEMQAEVAKAFEQVGS